MKLELKHLAPYLPYGLKAKLSKEGVFNLDSEYRNEYAYRICTIIDFTTYSKDLGGSMKVDETKDYRFDFDSLSEIEIILRPLSDLTKEIEHNGEKFYPYEKLHLCYSDVTNFLSEDLWIGQWWDYEKVTKLLEYHFDVFGLIEKGLAIDINNLNK